jgi:hypothetical protein
VAAKDLSMINQRVKRLATSLRDCSGANMIEAAIITPLLLLVTIALLEFSVLLFVFMALQNGVSQATRYAITGQQVAGQSREGSIKAAMRDATPTLTLDDSVFSFSHMPPGGTSWAGGAGGPGDIGKVTITYTWSFFTPLMSPFFDGNELRLTVESAMRNEPKFTE